MDKFTLSERYRLELHWSSVSYEENGVCTFNGAYFSGPALMEALKLERKDHILLDFFQQYLVLVDNAYVAQFDWEDPSYNGDGTISFRYATLSHDTELNRVPKLKDDDYLVIDTSGHDVEKHPFTLVYKTYVVNEDTQLYRFGG